MVNLNPFKKKKLVTTITTKEIPATTKPSVTFVDVGRQAPAGQEFVNSKGQSQGTFVRTGGYTIVGGRSHGSSGGSPSNIYSTSGEVTQEQAYKMEGGVTKTVQVTSTPNRNVNVSPSVLKSVQQQRLQQKMTSQSEPPRTYPKVYLEPTITRKGASVSGYTKSGKPIYTKGESYVINPPTSYLAPITRTATPEETLQLETYETEQGITGVPKMSYNPEDYMSYGDLFKYNQPQAIVRKGAYDVGKIIGAGLRNVGVPFTKSEQSQAIIRKTAGETALFVGFAPAMTTTAQTMVKIAQPTQVKFTGVSQKTSNGLTRTDVVFRAEKGGTVYKGGASGVAEVTPYNIEGQELYKILGQSKGVAGQRVLNIPKGLSYKNVQGFVSEEKGIGFFKNKLFYSATKGSMGVKPQFASGYGYSYYSTGVQVTGKKGVSAIFGSTVSDVGTSRYVGALFPIETQSVIKFIPIASKRGQVLVNPLKTIVFEPFKSNVPSFVQPVSLKVGEQASLSITKSSVQAFATTINPTAYVSQVTTGSSLLPRLMPVKQLEVSKSYYSFKPRENTVISSNFGLRNIASSKNVSGLKTVQRTKLSSISISELSQQTNQVQRVQQVQKQAQQLKQLQQTQQVQKQMMPSLQFNISRGRMKPIKPYFPFGRKSSGSGNTNFNVLLRRFGKFKTVGVTKTSQEAFNLGKFKTGTTLGATFKVEGSTQQPENIFGYRKKKTKEGILFIEQPKFRLSTGTEKKEINYYRNLAKRIQLKGGKGL